LFEANLRWLARAEQRHVLKIAAEALATALKLNDLCLALLARNADALRGKLAAA
jgi:hypothetical protein